VHYVTMSDSLRHRETSILGRGELRKRSSARHLGPRFYVRVVKLSPVPSRCMRTPTKTSCQVPVPLARKFHGRWLCCERRSRQNGDDNSSISMLGCTLLGFHFTPSALAFPGDHALDGNHQQVSVCSGSRFGVSCPGLKVLSAFNDPTFSNNTVAAWTLRV